MILDIRIAVRKDGTYVSSIESVLETTIPDLSLVSVKSLCLGETVDALVMAAIGQYLTRKDGQE